jgi:signal transduction histidine kinase
MLSPESKLSCHLNQSLNSEQEHQRLGTLRTLGLLDTESVPVFEEATQTAAHFLSAPICILGLLDRDRQWFKSAVGLSRIGLMNDLAASRQLPRHESFCTHVVDSQQVLMISDTATNPAFSGSLLVRRYGVRSYLGVPLISSGGQCLGTLAVMGLEARTFTPREVEFLQLMARWSMSEFERNWLLKQQALAQPDRDSSLPLPSSAPGLVKASLISQMTQDLCTPLTSILGMASVLGQGVHGSLSEKQKEYIRIIHNSGKSLLALVNEIVDLGALDNSDSKLNLSATDIEMLCQQVIATLNQAAQQRGQQIQLTVEPGQRIWLLDKEKVRQVLYHLVFNVIQSSGADSIIRIHVSRREDSLNLTIWMSHPWLGETLPPSEIAASSLLTCFADIGATLDRSVLPLEATADRPDSANWSDDDPDLMKYDPFLEKLPGSEAVKPPALGESRQGLGLILSCQLAEIHQGSVTIRGSVEEGYRYLVQLPQLERSKPM